MSVNLRCKDILILRIKWGTIKCKFVFKISYGLEMKGGSTKSDDQYQKAQMLKAIRCYRNLHCPEYAIIFLYSPGGFYPFS